MGIPQSASSTFITELDDIYLAVNSGKTFKMLCFFIQVNPNLLCFFVETSNLFKFSSLEKVNQLSLSAVSEYLLCTSVCCMFACFLDVMCSGD